MENKRETIVLYDEENNDQEFEVLAVLDVNENRYAVLMLVSEVGEEEEEEAYILRIEENEDGESVLVGLDDEEELNTVVEAYEELATQEDN